MLEGNSFTVENTFKGILPTIPYLANYSTGFSPSELDSKISQIENDERGEQYSRSTKKIGNIEDRDDSIVLTADLPGVEKGDIELSVQAESVSFKATTEDKMQDTVEEEFITENSAMAVYSQSISKAVKK